jgi:hypothetical protein
LYLPTYLPAGMFKSWYPPNIGCLRGLVCKRDRSERAMWMGLVQESNVNGIGPREQCEWDWSKRAMWMGSVQESHMNGIGPREQCEWDQTKRAMWKGIGLWEPYEWDWSKRAMWMGQLQESNVNGISPRESNVTGIGPREQCEWDWYKRAMWMGFGSWTNLFPCLLRITFVACNLVHSGNAAAAAAAYYTVPVSTNGIQSKRVQTTHDDPWPDTAGLRCAREFRACGAASRAFGASRRSTACLPACLPILYTFLSRACPPVTSPLLWLPARLSPLTLSSRARMHLRALSFLFLSLLRLLLFLSQPWGASSSSAASNSDLSLLHSSTCLLLLLLLLSFSIIVLTPLLLLQFPPPQKPLLAS